MHLNVRFIAYHILKDYGENEKRHANVQKRSELKRYLYGYKRYCKKRYREECPCAQNVSMLKLRVVFKKLVVGAKNKD